MATLQTPAYSTRQFHFNASENMLVAEASDLHAIGMSLFGRVYDDACDEGLTVVSHKTGRAVQFAVEHVEVDRREGELLWWELRPVNEREWAAGRVRIYND